MTLSGFLLGVTLGVVFLGAILLFNYIGIRKLKEIEKNE